MYRQIYQSFRIYHMEHYDIVVIGLGPAGLAFLSSYSGDKRILAVDSGDILSKRDRYDEVSAINGVGGAGLYSDGKFSFFPSGTELWKIDDMKNHMETIKQLFAQFGVSEIMENTDENTNGGNVNIEGWILKQYFSFRIDLETRIKIIENLFDKIKNKCNVVIKMQTNVLSIMNGNVINLASNGGITEEIQASKIIMAGGRFFPLLTKNLPNVFRRIEFGTRIYGSSDTKFYTQFNLLDPKLILREGDIEFRSFCWCKNGEMVLTNYNGIKTYSGRADISLTNESNFGFNMRFHNDSQELFKEMFMEPFDLTFEELKEKSKTNNLLQLYIKGIEKLSHVTGNDVFNMRFKGPTIEGVGYYPQLEPKSLKIVDNDIWTLGDTTGIFRGLVPAMISGYYLADIFD
ncbi:putative FAD-dependent dehydrogenase [Bodo saltans virus]|uniref:FAD-dependent dehydrogenase n=1 Tax=Bodo saltans virus TaxID=2024608 RepID=A0A2H4UU67_9VIRU|nr:putative FAD-dependent dehydrogenase [Bodo saltans virus]ATZ80365.1 putative FAD-dependent dehydrogenase [Bodo saltans virus]